MFTGIVHKGTVVRLKNLYDGLELEVRSSSAVPRLKKGESIAIDGACLSLVSQKERVLRFFVSPETLDKTRIGRYLKGDVVNIEYPLRRHDFLGGHYVLGHVDTTSTVKRVKKLEEVWIIEIALPKQFAKYLVYKGSVAVNGVSLTVNKIGAASFGLCIIPITLDKSNISSLEVGTLVNLEFDILAKYTESILKKST